MGVGLPGAWGPRNPTTSPRATSNDTSRTACVVPNDLERLRTEIMRGVTMLTATRALVKDAGGRRDSGGRRNELCGPRRMAGCPDPGRGACEFGTQAHNSLAGHRLLWVRQRRPRPAVRVLLTRGGASRPGPDQSPGTDGPA